LVYLDTVSIVEFDFFLKLLFRLGRILQSLTLNFQIHRRNSKNLRNLYKSVIKIIGKCYWVLSDSSDLLNEQYYQLLKNNIILNTERYKVDMYQSLTID
jgi:hypothetical protein